MNMVHTYVFITGEKLGINVYLARMAFCVSFPNTSCENGFSRSSYYSPFTGIMIQVTSMSGMFKCFISLC